MFVRTLFLATPLVIAGQVSAAILTDNFDSATTTGSGATTVIDSSADYGPVSPSTSTTLSLSSVNLGAGAGQSLQLTTTAAVNTFLKASLPQTVNLGAIGDYIQLDFKYQTSGGTNGNRVLRAGLFDAGITDEASVGYFWAGGTEGTSNFRLTSDRSVTVNDFLNTGTPSDGSNLSLSSISPNTTYDARIRIEKTNATTLTITGLGGPGGATLNSFTNTVAAGVTSFDQLWIGINNRTTIFRVDNISVTSNVPEPASLAGLALAGLVGLRRRR